MSVKWKLVDQDRLVVGGTLPEGCAVVPADEVVAGSVYWVFDSEVCERVAEIAGRSDCFRTDRDRKRYKNQFFNVVEPVVELLGRIPEVGEEFWIKVKCVEHSRPGYYKKYPISIRHGECWDAEVILHESFLGLGESK